MSIQNVSGLKRFINLKNNGQALICNFLENLLGCEIKLQQGKIADFEEHFQVNITENILRNCYKLSNDLAILVCKIYENKDVLAILPITIHGENVQYLDNRYLEQICNVLSKRLTECYNNSFLNGPYIFGAEFQKMVIAKCVCACKYNPARIYYLIDAIDRLSATTFEGTYFTTGLILSRSLYDFDNPKQNHRKGNILKLCNHYDLIKHPEVDKRFWYLVDGKSSFYLTDQQLDIKNVFVSDQSDKSPTQFFDSYMMNQTLLGDDLVFRVTGPNEISIMDSNEALEFVKKENNWRYRNFHYIDDVLKNSNIEKDNVRLAIIYYAIMCSSSHVSSIIWLPSHCDDSSIDKIITIKNRIFKQQLNIVNTTQEGTIRRILSSDGVTIINSEGSIMYCGGIVKLDLENKKGLLGTGASAAELLSENGIAIKISQDGTIKIFSEHLTTPILF